jgi:hypothetical protein
MDRESVRAEVNCSLRLLRPASAALNLPAVTPVLCAPKSPRESTRVVWSTPWESGTELDSSAGTGTGFPYGHPLFISKKRSSQLALHG